VGSDKIIAARQVAAVNVRKGREAIPGPCLSSAVFPGLLGSGGIEWSASKSPSRPVIAIHWKGGQEGYRACPGRLRDDTEVLAGQASAWISIHDEDIAEAIRARDIGPYLGGRIT
jgi:hypothetical protein